MVVPVGLVLGDLVCADGRPLEFLLARLGIARMLYTTGKVRVLLVSGDNSRPGYDEPDVMRMWLIDHGVPDAKVVADYAVCRQEGIRATGVGDSSGSSERWTWWRAAAR